MLKIYFTTIFFLNFPVILAKEAPIVSVRIGKSLKNILVSGTDLKGQFFYNNKNLVYRGEKSLKFNCETDTTLNKQKNTPILLASLKSSTGLLSFSKEKFQGMFKVITSKDGDSCDIINDIPMEEYISSLLTKEMNASWPTEALKAQAVAARTYALHKINTQQVTKELGALAHYDLESSEKHQVSGNFHDVTKSTIAASFSTTGEVLTNLKGEVRPIYFHAKCGGRTLRPDQVWHNLEEGYQSVNCPFCHDIGPKGWKQKISFQRLKLFLNWGLQQGYLKESLPKNINSIILVPDNNDKFVINFYINDRPFIIEKTALRKFFGRVLFPSNNFSLKSEKDGVSIWGEGSGHGVGLCQTGAFALAKLGWSYKKILAHYFPGHILKKIY